MLMFLGYWLPMIVLIGGLIVFKKLFVKCIKTSDYYDYYRRNVIQEPIMFPIWQYILYFACVIVPVLNWITIIALLITFCDNDYFCSYSWSRRDYWYEIPEAKINTFFEQLAKKIEIVLNNKWFMIACIPFVYLYKIMTKKV